MSDASDDTFDAYLETLARMDALSQTKCNCPDGKPVWDLDDDGLYVCRGCGLIVEV